MMKPSLTLLLIFITFGEKLYQIQEETKLSIDFPIGANSAHMVDWLDIDGYGCFDPSLNILSKNDLMTPHCKLLKNKYSHRNIDPDISFKKLTITFSYWFVTDNIAQCLGTDETSMFALSYFI